jgi:ATP-dependent helicase YprA (DUF1998 family)
MYHGAFGMHTGMVLRRLRRLCALYGSNPRFICCSATIGESSHEHFRLTQVNQFPFNMQVNQFGVEGRGSRVEGRGSRVEGRGLKDQRV